MSIIRRFENITRLIFAAYQRVCGVESSPLVLTELLIASERRGSCDYFYGSDDHVPETRFSPAVGRVTIEKCCISHTCNPVEMVVAGNCLPMASFVELLLPAVSVIRRDGVRSPSSVSCILPEVCWISQDEVFVHVLARADCPVPIAATPTLS